MKRWISAGRLAREHGLSWVDAEKIIREEALRIRRQGRTGILFTLISMACAFWIIGGANWLFPKAHGLVRLATVLIAFAVQIAMLFAPRMWAGDAILSRARQHTIVDAFQNS